MNRIPGRTCAVIASALLLAACAPPVPLAPSAPTTPPQGAPPLVPSTFPSEPTSTSAPIDLSSLEDEANSLRPTQPPPVPTPTPIFEWPEDIPYGDIPAALEYIHGRFGPPDEILYRYSGFGHGMDYGADFSDRISFETRLVYQDLGADFQLRSNPQVQLTGSHTGVARLCLAYTTEEDPNIWYDTSLWDVESRVPQKRLLFQDLAEAAHTSLSSLWDRFRTPFSCTNVPITFPQLTFFPTAVTELANFTAPPEDCQPPCWYSLKPGVSGQSEIEAFFARLGVDPSDIDTHDAELPDLSMSSAYFEDFPHQFPGLPPRVSVLSSSNGVTSIQLEGLHPDFIAPSDVISALGTPEEIVIWIDSRIELRYFTLILRHPQHHTSVFVSGNLVPNEDYTDELLCIKDEAATSTDVLFYADPSDAYHEVSLLEDYPVTPQMIEQETQYEWISLPQTPGLQLRLEEAAQILARKEACLPPLQ